MTLFTFPSEDYGWFVPKKSKNTFKIICGLKIVTNRFSTIPASFAVEMPNLLSYVKTRFFLIKTNWWKKKWRILGKVKRVSGKVKKYTFVVLVVVLVVVVLLIVIANLIGE